MPDRTPWTTRQRATDNATETRDDERPAFTSLQRTHVTTCVYLLRHGPAGLRSAWSGDDADRPLTTDGAREMERIAAALAAQGLAPDLMLTSPLARARQTASILATALGQPDLTIVNSSLLAPSFCLADLQAILSDHHDATSVVLVGHEPALSGVTLALCGARIVLQKGALVEVDVNRDDLSKSVLVRLEQPAHLLR